MTTAGVPLRVLLGRVCFGSVSTDPKDRIGTWSDRGELANSIALLFKGATASPYMKAPKAVFAGKPKESAPAVFRLLLARCWEHELGSLCHVHHRRQQQLGQVECVLRGRNLCEQVEVPLKSLASSRCFFKHHPRVVLFFP